MRVGIGYDSHRFADGGGRKLILGGVEIPHPQGLAGHSDADVVAHALTDAILGAAALGDIGGMFPETDPRWKDCSSLYLLSEEHTSELQPLLYLARRLMLGKKDKDSCSPSSEGPSRGTCRRYRPSLEGLQP